MLTSDRDIASLRSRILWVILLLLGAVIASRSAPAQSTPPPSETLSDSVPVDSLLPATIRPPKSITVADAPNDGGGTVIVSWELSPDDIGHNRVTGYKIYRANSADGPFAEIGDEVQGKSHFTDNKAETGAEHFYRVDAYLSEHAAGGELVTVAAPTGVSRAVVSKAQWFNNSLLICFVLVLFVSFSIMFFIRKAKKGGSLYVRKIAGIDAVDEAVGRATEMGKKIFFVPGIQDMNDVQTIAGIAILGRVAAVAAQYETYLEVPVSKSLVMVTARETMKEAYSKIGRPDAFQEDQVHYLTDDQFGYAAAIDGMVVRDKPATIFYMGAFFAESLILAETGNSAGAIQIAGTAMPAQLPFFVAACDYTLIGEELFAASAYLSREPRQLGSLKGQDVGKALFLVLILVGLLLATVFGWDASSVFKVGN